MNVTADIKEFSKNGIHKKDPMEYVFIPTSENKPPQQPSVLLNNGVSVLSFQNNSLIVGSPGNGKSSQVEAILSAVMLNGVDSNNNRDCLGWSVAPHITRALCIDVERTDIDLWNSFDRSHRRAGLRNGINTNVQIAGLRKVPIHSDKKNVTEKLIQGNKPQLLIVDGAADFVSDTNDLEEAVEFKLWLRHLADKYALSIVLTVHPNKGSLNPRGHFSGEFLRECETVLCIKRISEEIRSLTSDFEHGKTRNSGEIKSAFQWSEDVKMFVSVDIENINDDKAIKKVDKKLNSYKNLVRQILPDTVTVSYTSLTESIMKTTGLEVATSKRRIAELVVHEFIIKNDDGTYSKGNI